jgi:hypothetical protein
MVTVELGTQLFIQPVFLPFVQLIVEHLNGC